MRHLRAVNKYFRKYRLRLLAGIAFIVISNYFAIMAPQITAYVVDKVQLTMGGSGREPGRNYDWLVNRLVGWLENSSQSLGNVVALCGITILVLAVIRGIFMFFMRQTIIVMSRHIEYDQKNEVFAHYLKLDAGFYKQHATGDLMNRIAEDVSRVRMYTGPAIMYLINLVTTIAFAVSNMLARDVRLTLMVLAPLPILAFTIYYVNAIIHRRSERIQAQLSDLTTQAQQAYSGIRVIKSYVQEDAMLRHFDESSERYRDQAIGLAKVEAIYSPAIVFLIGLSTLITIMMGGLYYLNGQISEVGIIVEFVLYVNMLTFPVSAIGWVAGMIQRAAASQKRLNEFLDQQPAIRDEIAAQPATLSAPQPGLVEFRQVSFTYPHTGIRAVSHFNLQLQPGQRVAIVGRTGSGKSTVAQLLLRMHDVDEGAVLLGGRDIRTWPLAELRRQISYVPQDVFLFSDTVANNIAFGQEDAEDGAIRRVAEQAAVAGEIERFDKGYETMVGERGVTLSGGQKQRISMARALLKTAQVYVFDDCLSAVDAETEKAVQRELDESLKGKTAIFITHRIFSLLHFDQVIVMDDGQIIEQGTHESLLQLGGEYARLYQLQQQTRDEPAVQG